MFMVVSFYFEAILGICLEQCLLIFGGHSYWNPWLITAHPLTRIPVFFMGMCAGVLCLRIQNQDLQAMQCKHDL